MFVTANNVILVCLRDFEPGKVDVVYVYKTTETRKLHKMGKIPSYSLGFGNGDEEDAEESPCFRMKNQVVVKIVMLKQ